MKRFEELLAAYEDVAFGEGYRTKRLDVYGDMVSPCDRSRAARLTLVEYVRELIEPKPGDPCVGDSRDTGVW